MDIFAYIERDHVTVKHLFDQANRVISPEERLRLFGEIRKELILDLTAEEKTFYTAILDAAAKRGESKHRAALARIHHSEEGHNEILAKLKMVETSIPGMSEWNSAFDALKETTERHVRDDESKLFALARKLLTQCEADDLAPRMEQMKAELKSGQPDLEDSAPYQRVVNTSNQLATN